MDFTYDGSFSFCFLLRFICMVIGYSTYRRMGNEMAKRTDGNLKRKSSKTFAIQWDSYWKLCSHGVQEYDRKRRIVQP